METHIVAKGLAIQIPDELDITYQTLPFYDDHEFCLARWFSESLQYVMAINKLPDGWLDAEKWMAGFQRDMRSLSKWGSCKEGKSEVFVSPAGFAISSLEMYYVIKGEDVQRHQIMSYLTDYKNAYTVPTTPFTPEAEDVMFSESKMILGTAFAPEDTITLFPQKKENVYFGHWVGASTTKTGGVMVVEFQLASDYTFVRTDKVKGESDAITSGVWSVVGDEFYWTYGRGLPTTQARKSVEVNRVVSINDNEMVLDDGEGYLLMVSKIC